MCSTDGLVMLSSTASLFHSVCFWADHTVSLCLKASSRGVCAVQAALLCDTYSVRFESNEVCLLCRTTFVATFVVSHSRPVRLFVVSHSQCACVQFV